MKKKILIVADTYIPKVDGIVRFMQQVVPKLAHHFDVTLLVPDYHRSWDVAKEIRIKLSRIFQLSGYKLMRFTIGNFKKIRDAVKNSDTVFIQGPALISLVALYYAKKYEKRIVTYIHIILWELYDKDLPRIIRWPTIPILKKLSVKWYNWCDVLVLPYENLSKELTRLGIRTKKVVAELGVDSSVFRPLEDKNHAKHKLEIDPSYTVIGYVGRISKEKNVAVLLEAVKRLQEKYKILLLIVGSGSKELMRKFEKAKNTVLPGFVQNVVPYYQAMDVFVMPSLTETTSLATLEAMSCAIPVVTTKVGFLQDYVRKDYNGLFFPKGNDYNLILQLQKLLNNVKVRERMGKNAHATALRFTWKETAHRIKEVLDRF